MASSRRRMSKFEEYTHTSAELADDERTKRLTTLVFNQEKLKLFRDAISELFNIFEDILKNEYGEEDKFLSPSEVHARLAEVDGEQWKELRYRYLDDPYFGINEIGFTNSNNTEPAKLMMEFIETLDGVRNSVTDKMADYSKSEKNMQDNIKELQERLAKAQDDILDAKLHTGFDRTEMKTAQDRIEHLEQTVEDKIAIIQQLERDSNVVLWEKEKNKLFDTSRKKEANLVIRIKELEEENNRMKDKLTKKLTEADEQNKMLKLKHQVTSARHVGGSGQNAKEIESDVEELKRRIYYLEKDVQNYEQELVNQQKYITGILAGLKIDLKKQGELLPFSTSKKDKDKVAAAVNKFTKFIALIEKLHQAAIQGTLSTVRSDLPEYYFALDREIKPIKDNFKRMSAMFQEKNKNLSLQVESLNVNGSISSQPIIKETEKEPASEKSTKPAPPELVHRETGRVNMIAVMKHYPHLSSSAVKEHWEQFKRYDRNGDYTLDLSEMMVALNATVGQTFTASQIKEALQEIDLDGSEDLDFFEYLGVASLLMRKQGQAEIFHTDFVEHNHNVVSKTCAIQ